MGVLAQRHWGGIALSQAIQGFTIFTAQEKGIQHLYSLEGGLESAS